jgi:hypothetical protein
MTIMGIAGHVSREMLITTPTFAFRQDVKLFAFVEARLPVSKPVETSESVRPN